MSRRRKRISDRTPGNVARAMFKHTRPRLESSVKDELSSKRLKNEILIQKNHGNASFSSITEEEAEKREELFRVKKLLSERERGGKHGSGSSKKRESRKDVDDLERLLGDVDGLMDSARSKILKKKTLRLDEDDDMKGKRRKRFRPAIVQIQDSVDKNLKLLADNPDKLRKLKEQIKKYEQQHTKFGDRVKKQNFINENITRAGRYRDFDRKRRDKNKKEREEFRFWTLYNKGKNDLESIELREKRHKKYLSTLERAVQAKENKPKLLLLREKQQKWSFIVSLMSRVYLMYSTLEMKREAEFEAKRRRELTSIVFQRMMPIVRAKRHEDWVNAWIRFKKHWVFFKLWMSVAKKKRAIYIIKTFLRCTGIDASFVKKVNSFRSNIRKCQYYVSKFDEVVKCRSLINLLRYTIVESKIILDQSVIPKKKPKFVTKNTDSRSISSGDLLSKPGKESSGGSIKYRKKKDQSGSYSVVSNMSLSAGKSGDKKSEFLDSFVRPSGSGPVCQLRPSMQEKLELVNEYFDQRREKYFREYPQYLLQVQDYRDRLLQQEFMEKAHSLLTSDFDYGGSVRKDKEEEGDDGNKVTKKGGLDMEEKKYLIDQDGNQIPYPKKPFLSAFISEKEMEVIVRRGFKIVREKEEKVYRGFVSSKMEIGDLLESLDDEREKYKKFDEEVFETLRKYFGAKMFDERKKLFTHATDVVNYIRKQRFHVHAVENNMKRKKK